MKNSGTCGNCKFSSEEGDEVLTCLRYPPTTPVFDDGGWRWYHVEVESYHWCGEFKPVKKSPIKIQTATE